MRLATFSAPYSNHEPIDIIYRTAKWIELGFALGEHPASLFFAISAQLLVRSPEFRALLDSLTCLSVNSKERPQ